MLQVGFRIVNIVRKGVERGICAGTAHAVTKGQAVQVCELVPVQANLISCNFLTFEALG